MANPTVQKQPLCTTCGMKHHVSQCPKEKDKLQKEAKVRGEKLPGMTRSTKRNTNQDNAEGANASADYDSGCFMCFALEKPTWQYHSPNKCFTKDEFTKGLCDPEQRSALLDAKVRKPNLKVTPKTNGSDRTRSQSNAGNHPRNDRQTQSSQSSRPSPQH